MNIEWLPSPNHNARPKGRGVEGVVIHATAGKSEAGDVAWCRKSKADHAADYLRGLERYKAARARGERVNPPTKYSPVSYHWIIGRTGKIYQLVEESRRAWHAGKSRWLGKDNCNDFTVGVALSFHPSEGEYPAPQLDAAVWLTADILKRRGLRTDRIAGHHEISPTRKTDPYPAFPWLHFRVAVINLLHPPPEPFDAIAYVPPHRWRPAA